MKPEIGKREMTVCMDSNKGMKFRMTIEDLLLECFVFQINGSDFCAAVLKC